MFPPSAPLPLQTRHHPQLLLPEKRNRYWCVICNLALVYLSKYDAIMLSHLQKFTSEGKLVIQCLLQVSMIFLLLFWWIAGSYLKLGCSHCISFFISLIIDHYTLCCASLQSKNYNLGNQVEAVLMGWICSSDLKAERSILVKCQLIKWLHTWYCTYSNTRSFTFDPVFVNSISSVPSPIHQCKNALCWNIAVDCSEMCLKISWIAVVLPLNIADIRRPRGVMSLTATFTFFGIHSKK